MSLSIDQLWGSMGWFAQGICILILLMSILSTQVSIRKLLQFRAAERTTRRFLPVLAAALERDDLQAAAQAVDAHAHSHVAQLMRTVFPAWRGRPSAERASDAIVGIERTLEVNQLVQIGEFRRGLSTLATIGATAPFVGLLGTVTGIMNAFVGMSQANIVGLEAVASGVAEALVTTAFGLIVAIPSVWLYNYYLGRIEHKTLEMGRAGLELLDYLHRSEAEPSEAEIGEGHVAAHS